MEITRSPLSSRMPRTPVESRPANTRTSVTGKRMLLPPSAASSTSWCSVQMATLTRLSPSSSFIAILPLALTDTKSLSRLRRMPPLAVENMTNWSSA